MTTTCTSDLSSWFPRNTTGSLDDPGSFTIHCLPITFTLLYWASLELVRFRRRSSFFVSWFAYVVTMGIATTQVFLAWRVFDLLDCQGDQSGKYRLVAVIGAPLATVGLVLFSRRFARTTTLVCLILTGATLYADWVLREEGLERAAQPLVAVQQLWLLLAITCLVRLPAKSPRGPCAVSSATKSTPIIGSSRKESSARIELTVIDPLSRIEDRQPVPSDRHASWFL